MQKLIVGNSRFIMVFVTSLVKMSADTSSVLISICGRSAVVLHSCDRNCLTCKCFIPPTPTHSEVLFAAIVPTRRRIVVLIPNHSRIIRQNSVDATGTASRGTVSRHSTNLLLLEFCTSSPLQLLSTWEPCHSRFLRCSTCPPQSESEYVRNSSGKVRPMSLTSIKKSPLSVVNQVTSKAQHLPMLLGWCLHASSQHANHETRIWSIRAHVIQQSNNLSEGSCCSVQFFFI